MSFFFQNPSRGFSHSGNGIHGVTESWTWLSGWTDWTVWVSLIWPPQHLEPHLMSCLHDRRETQVPNMKRVFRFHHVFCSMFTPFPLPTTYDTGLQNGAQAPPPTLRGPPGKPCSEWPWCLVLTPLSCVEPSSAVYEPVSLGFELLIRGNMADPFFSSPIFIYCLLQICLLNSKLHQV